MIEWLLEPLGSAFVNRAILTGVIVSAITAMVGVWVVIRGMTFLGEAMGHGMLPGVSIAALFNVNLIIGAAGSALVMALGVNALRKNRKLGADTSIGLLYLGLLSLGVIIVSYSASFAGDLTAFLFGDILGVSLQDLALLLGALLVVAAIVFLFYRPFVALSFDVHKAETLGLRPHATNLVMLLLIVVSIAASFQAVGTLLAFGMLIAPSATALLVARKIPIVMLLAFLFGSVSSYLGLLISWHFDTAAGSTIALVQVLGFFFVGGTSTLLTRIIRFKNGASSPAAPLLETAGTPPHV